MPAIVALCRKFETLRYEDVEWLCLRTVVEIRRINKEDMHSRSGEGYDVKAALRASHVLISHSTSRSASAGPTTDPFLDNPPPPANSLAPVMDNEHSRLGKLAKGHDFYLHNPSLYDVNDNVAYLTMLTAGQAERAHAPRRERLVQHPNLPTSRCSQDCISPCHPHVKSCGSTSSLAPYVAEECEMCGGLGHVRGSEG
ncbi:uncharacterized protein SCHCODRAFT_01099103 [Schizophyllum commune H4-8]|nr:uncharacterized protein SCHCODRAFT_01099103 [Schizophyllum commune H4-8]KAI5890032.1 hypothetical protein SCHCODRAFT_01099103 [Schizophyllum commune H4-8]